MAVWDLRLRQTHNPPWSRFFHSELCNKQTADRVSGLCQEKQMFFVIRKRNSCLVWVREELCFISTWREKLLFHAESEKRGTVRGNFLISCNMLSYPLSLAVQWVPSHIQIAPLNVFKPPSCHSQCVKLLFRLKTRCNFPIIQI